MGQGTYTIVGALPRGSDNQTLLALKEDGPERQGVVLRPVVEGVALVQPPSLPGLVPVLGFDEVDGHQYALYEFAPGVTLREILAAFKATQRRAPLGLAGRVVVDAARVVSALHTGSKPLLHGSIHDGAVLVGFEGTTRLIDVGAGRRTRFSAPELGKGEEPSPRSDVYGLAALMHAAATGFQGQYAQVAVRAATSADLPPPSRHHADATPELDGCLFRALTTNPSMRAASARLFADELEKALGDKLFTREQVGATLSELFGDRVAALKSAIVRAAQDTQPPRGPRPSRPKNPVSESPTAPRPSGPRPRPSRPSAPPVRMVPGTQIPADTQAGKGGPEEPPEPVVLVESEPDPMLTRPERPKPSAPAAARKRVSRPDAPSVRPGPPVPSEPALPAVPIDDSPSTGVEAAYRPGDAGPTGVEGAYEPADGGAQLSISNDPDADAGALGAEEANPTAIRPRAAAARPRPSAPGLKQQTEEERARAAGQEVISTSELDPENLGDLAQLQDEPVDEAVHHEPTNVKARPQPPPGRAPLEDDALDETNTKKKAPKKKGGGGLLLLTFLVVVGTMGALSWKFRPWRGKPLPAWVPPKIAELAIADGALPPVGAEPQLDVVQLTDEQAEAPTPEEAAIDAGAPAAEEPAADGGAAAVAPAVAAAAELDAGAAALDAGAAPAADAGAADAGVKAAAPEPEKKPKKKKRRW